VIIFQKTIKVPKVYRFELTEEQAKLDLMAWIPIKQPGFKQPTCEIIGLEAVITFPDQLVGTRAFLHVGDVNDYQTDNASTPAFVPPVQVRSSSLPEIPSAPAPVSGRKKVLSISIGDMSAISVLNYLDDINQYDIFTGSGFGGVLSLLLASCQISDVKNSPIDKIKQCFRERGKYITKEGLTKPARVFAKVSDVRNSFGHLEAFLKFVVPDIENIQVRDLEADLFFPILNVKTDDPGYITKEDAGELPVLAAARCIASTFQDYEPLELTDSNPKLKDALGSPGTIWNHQSIGKICPDLMLARHYRYRGLSFDTFVRPYKPSKVKTKLLKKFWLGYPHVKAVEASYSQDAGIVVDTMSELPHINYNFCILPVTTWKRAFIQSDIVAALDTRPRQIGRF